MPKLTFKEMQIEFEKKLTELGLSYSVHHDGFYAISSKQDGANPMIVRLKHPIQISKQVSGSKNGNEVQAIGKFIFKHLSSGHLPDFLSLAFPNSVKNRVEFIIIPTQEFLRRHAKMNTGSVRRKSIVVVIWLMEDGFVYDTTNISPEGEWFFLSKGANGRLADRTELDYSEYMNNLQRLIAL